MTSQNSKSNQNKINSGGLKSAIAHNNSVKPNSNLIQTLKIALPQFFDSDKKFQTDKFLAELQENNIAESRDGYKLGFVGKDYARLRTITNRLQTRNNDRSRCQTQLSQRK
ncbi:MAG: hypothetical protein LBE18_07790 [Planctomycetaceae bacterium]|jgi:hypothetical protein|nr:hypothetical protein [Planctomycetaceae bacterium]